MRQNRSKNPPPRVLLAEAIGRFREYHRKRSIRMSAAKERIVEAVLAREGHFDLEDLVGDLRSRRVSRATLYRVLPLLREAGILQPTVISGGKRQFEPAFGREHHDHLICAACGRVVEFQFEAIEILQREVASKHGFELTAHVHELIGRCAACRAAPDPPRAGGEAPAPTGGTR